MSRPSWVDRVNQTSQPDEPPRTGKGSTTQAWRVYATDLGYPVPADAGRNVIIALVDAGPPPTADRRLARIPKAEGPVYEATRAAVAAATHLLDLDQPTVAVLLDLAQSIDGMELRPSTAPLDNWTIPTFLRYAEALGLTPAARQRLDVKQPKKKTALEMARERWGGGHAAG